MKTITNLFYVLCMFFLFQSGSNAQSLHFQTQLTKDGRYLHGLHTLQFSLVDDQGKTDKNWSYTGSFLLSNGSISLIFGSGPVPGLPTIDVEKYALSISEKGVVLGSIPFSSNDNTIDKHNALQTAGAKVLLSDLDQANALIGQVLTWSQNGEWQPKTPTGGSTNSTGINTLNKLKGDIVIDAKPPLKLSSTTEKITLEVDNGQPTYNVPVGSIIAYFGLSTSVPDGWLLCDGQAAVGDLYPQLRDRLKDLGFVGDKTPDLRGQFLRGANLTRDSVSGDPDWKKRSGTGEKIGSVQGDELKKHMPVYAVGMGTGDFDAYSAARWPGPKGTDPRFTDPGGNETRPKNVAVNYIIKAK